MSASTFSNQSNSTHNDQSDFESVGMKDVTVKFQIDETQFVANTYCNSLSVQEVKEDIAEKFQVQSNQIVLKQDAQILPDDAPLLDAMCNEFGVVEIQIDLTEEAADNEVILDPNIYYSSFALNDVITVQVPAHMSTDGCAKTLLVEIENKAIVKPFLGGYLNRKTNVEYHDAFSQTGPTDQQILKLNVKQTRETQTAKTAVTAAETTLDTAIQVYGVAKELTYIPEMGDYEICAKEYESYEKRMEKMAMLQKVLLIQRNFRRYLLQKHIKKKAAEWRSLVLEQEALNETRKEEYIKQHEEKCIIKAYPKTKQDFELLHAQVESWKEKEMKRISEQYSGASKIAELHALLDKEVKLLNDIERQRLNVRQELEEERNVKLLRNLGRPVSWINRKNKVLEMDTLNTQRARYLTKFFVELKQTNKNKEDRMSILTKIIPIILNEQHSKVQELTELIERERNMIIRGIEEESMEGLRKRQIILFLDIIKNEENEMKNKTKKKLCGKCRIVRPVHDFPMQTRSSVAICQQCSYLNAPPMDNTVYLSILRAIRRDERRRGALSSFAFIIQENDIKYIVESIWHGHSILSQCEVRSDLRLPRYNIKDDWAPWNCILLTESEARLHVKIRNLELVYEENVLKDIKNKQELARGAFKQLKDVDNVFVESGEWWNAGMNEDD